jgi:outer membrane protein OmpA-like peptidoglycan-associated protein
MEKSKDEGLSQASESLVGFVDRLAQAISLDMSSDRANSASFTRQNQTQTQPNIQNPPAIQPSSPASPTPIDPDTQAIDGLFELLVGKPLAEVEMAVAQPEKISHLHQLNVQLSERLLQLESQLDAANLRQTHLLNERINELESQLRAANQQIQTLLHEQMTQAKIQGNFGRFPIGLLGGSLICLGIIFLPGAIERYRYHLDRQTVSEVQRIATTFNQIDGTSINARWKAGNVTLEGTALPIADLPTITQTFQAIPGVKSVTNGIQVQPFPIPTRIYFPINSAQVVLQDFESKIAEIEKFLRQYPGLKLQIIGHAHPNERGSSSLALARSQTVQNILADRGIDRRRLSAIAKSGSPADVTANPEQWLSQCVLFEVIE